MNEELKLTKQAQQTLLKAMKWLQFFAVLGAIAAGMIIIAAIIFCIVSFINGGPSFLFVSLLYLVLGAVYFYPVKKTFDLISNTRLAIYQNDPDQLELAAGNFHTILKYCGILTIAIVVLYLLAFIAIAATGFNPWVEW